MTKVQVRSMGGITTTGEKRKYLDQTLSQWRNDDKKSHREWNERTVFAVQYERGKWWPVTSFKKHANHSTVHLHSSR